MPVTFNCTCGKRLKAGDAIIGKSIRCPHCGALRMVPGEAPVMEASAAPAVQTPESPFELDFGDAAPPASLREKFPIGRSPEPEPLQFAWLAAREASPARAIPPPLELPPVVIAEASPIPERSPSPFFEVAPREPESPPPAPLAVNEPASLDGLVTPVDEPIRPTGAASSAGAELKTVPRGLREPWFLTWAEAIARVVSVSAIGLAVLVPAAFLVGGLVALSREGDPKALLRFALNGVRIFPWMLAVGAADVALALLWAAPVQLLVDLWRRYRLVTARLDALLERMHQPEHEPSEREEDSSM